ncbi:MAG: tetratricopeptide repeat protein [Rhodopseudomonas palustris]|nr:tetratricopeptide repeat protein [Rhodopseudomonas palustris]
MSAGIRSRSGRTAAILFPTRLKVTQKNEIAHNNLAYALYQEGDMTGAVAHLREAVRDQLPVYDGSQQSGHSAGASGKDTMKPIGEYEKTLKINPRHGGALFNMGLALASKGKLSEAKGYFELLVRVEPDHVQAHQQVGRNSREERVIREAITHFQEALRLSPGDRGLTAAIARGNHAESSEKRT